MISNLISALNQAISFDSLLSQLNCYACVYFLMNTYMEEGVFFIKEAISLYENKNYNFFCSCVVP